MPTTAQYSRYSAKLNEVNKESRSKKYYKIERKRRGFSKVSFEKLQSDKLCREGPRFIVDNVYFKYTKARKSSFFLFLSFLVSSKDWAENNRSQKRRGNEGPTKKKEREQQPNKKTRVLTFLQSKANVSC